MYCVPEDVEIGSWGALREGLESLDGSDLSDWLERFHNHRGFWRPGLPEYGLADNKGAPASTRITLYSVHPHFGWATKYLSIRCCLP